MNGRACSSNCARASTPASALSFITRQSTSDHAESTWASTSARSRTPIMYLSFTRVEPMSADGYSPATPHASPRGEWDAPVAPGPLRATVTVPGSKSLTNRELILASIADGPSVLPATLHPRTDEHTSEPP